MTTATRGRKPTLNADRAPLARVPKAPSHLSPEAKAEWKRVLPRLVEDRIVTTADLGGVEDLCTARGIVRQIERERQAAGGVIDPKMFGVLNRAAQTARQLAAEYGLSPVSRSRIASTAAEDDDATTRSL